MGELTKKFSIFFVAYLQSWQRRRMLPMMQKLMLRKPLLTQPGSWKKFADDLHLRPSRCFPFAVKNNIENLIRKLPKKSLNFGAKIVNLGIFTIFGAKIVTF